MLKDTAQSFQCMGLEPATHLYQVKHSTAPPHASKTTLALIQPTFFCPENFICFWCLLHSIQMHFRLNLIMEANTMNPDQTAHLGAV